MRISDFIEASNKAKTPEEVFSLYEKALATYGFDRIMYSALSDHPIYDSVNSPSIMRNYPDDWISHYVEKGYVQKDPVRPYCAGRRSPFVWKDMMSSVELASEQERVMFEGEEAGLYDGLAVPLHGPYGELLGVGMASSIGGAVPDSPPSRSNLLSTINLLTIQFNNAYTALDRQTDESAPPIHLTTREREVLHWCMKGKSNWAIGEILKISEHGVDFHMRNIFAKLNTDSRITAVVKAIRLSLITP